MKIDLSHQHILVTGGTRGIGAAISRLLVKCGASVVANYHSQEEAAERLKKELGSQLHLIKADLGGAMEVTRLFTETMDYFNGRLDGLVNNAGIAIPSSIEKSVIDWTDDWLRTMDVNVNAVGLLSMRSVKQFMKQETGGRIITLSSRAAFRGDTEDYLAYATSKAAVVSLTKSIARAYGKHEIKAFVVAPGFTKTDMAQKFIDQYGEDFAKSDIALKELTQPEDVAPTIAFLLSGHMDHATGTTIDINAGSYVH
ncbi:SDR family oxidoreductase [Marivirga atlantica]|jgi:NAD(P)-dependent dehydrogenase (short-subunit alcohol dehydrogenase family)|uniref:SDR family oxidoreductase n=1 Tax=Marivirga atlantica TaxID=1548457 RepID=A0A937ACJ8_9BACT|nr:SDR family oxidoreductase [Marivirga atlantica]MBL0764161.1 SDR family oxidoreductase [Marivirga atlantica]